MGWDPSNLFHAGPLERDQSRNVKQLLENYRQKCISTCLLYPTFRSSSVIMTMSAVRTVANANFNIGAFRKGDSKTLEIQAKADPPSQPQKKIHGSAFLRFWCTEQTRGGFLGRLSHDDLASVRRACHDFSVHAAPFLFANLTVTFRPSTFTRPARMAALERIGHHVRTLTFVMPHTAETFLPPLIDPITGKEKVFVYEPQAGSSGSVRHPAPGPKYGSWEMTDLLIKQYGPLFHAATNVPAFIRALTAMSLITHLKISCPGQPAAQRYRRSAVDYALISLRMAIERAPLKALSDLSLMPIHAGGLLYLRSVLGLGALPNGIRRWAQIRRLIIHMESWAFDLPYAATDHLKLLHSFLMSFSPALRRLVFRWTGARGPCPFTLDIEPILMATASKQRLPRLRFPQLRYAELSNAHPDASQLSRFINRHRRTLQECDFDEVELRSGDWDEALAVLTRISGSEKWKEDMLAAESAPVLNDGGAVGSSGMDGWPWSGSLEHPKEFLHDSVALGR